MTIAHVFRVRLGQGIVDEVRQIESGNSVGDVESFSSFLGSQWPNPLPILFAGKVLISLMSRLSIVADILSRARIGSICLQLD